MYEPCKKYLYSLQDTKKYRKLLVINQKRCLNFSTNDYLDGVVMI